MNGAETTTGAGNSANESQGTTAAAPANDQQGITPAASAAGSAGASSPATVDAATLATFRAAIVAANPDAIPELIAGSDFAAITASVEGAKQAYARIAQAIKPEGDAAFAPSVPAGGGGAPIVHLDKMPAAAKIAHGLAARRKAG